MRNINSDLLHTHLVMNGRRFPNYNRVYYHSNENLKELFSFIDVKDKDVLSVLASGDQVFHFYANGAKKVETFDVNRLTFYYYYIRLWTLKYIGEYYPEHKFSINFLRNLLGKVKIRSEEEKKLVKLFYCPGGLNYEKMNGISRFMMKMYAKILNAKKNKTEEDEAMIKMISSSYDISDRKYIKPILECLQY